MSDFKSGDYYYIKNNDLVDQTFLESLGKLMSVLAQKAIITTVASNYTDIVDVSGRGWLESSNTKHKTLNVGYITSGFNKTYLAIVKVTTESSLQ